MSENTILCPGEKFSLFSKLKNSNHTTKLRKCREKKHILPSSAKAREIQCIYNNVNQNPYLKPFFK